MVPLPHRAIVQNGFVVADIQSAMDRWINLMERGCRGRGDGVDRMDELLR